MITPRFSCSQTAQSVIVSIYCPSVRASEAEINLDDTLLTVHINPYFLRLNFSHRLQEDDESSAKYDGGSGYLTLTLTKEVPGQEFTDLDLLAKLLAPRPSGDVPQQPVIEVLESRAAVEDELVAQADALSLEHFEQERREILEAAANDWQLPQEVPQPLPSFQTTLEKPYGFLGMHSGYFKHVSHTENEVNELGSDAETCHPVEKRKRRIEHENGKADYADDEYIRVMLTWKNLHITTDIAVFEYSKKENAAILKLPRKEYLATEDQTRTLYLTLLTLLFSYAYETRTNQHDPGPESAWTIGSLTPAFSALDPPPYDSPSPGGMFNESGIRSTMIPSYRRSLSFPLYRSFALAEACRADVANILLQGRSMVVRCLLEMKDILDHHEVYYVYNKIWTDDFCVWVQANAQEDKLNELGSLLKGLKIEKKDIGWDLEELEALTRDAEREEDSDDDSD